MAKNVGKALRDIERERSKRERFLRVRMWFSTFISMLYPDRVKIPENIGNNVFIGNNQVVTRNSMASYILVREFSNETPIAFTSKLVKDVKTAIDDVAIDYIIKNRRYNVNLKEGGLTDRQKQWSRTLENPAISDRIKLRAARLLYTLDVAKSGEVMFKSRVYLKVLAKNGLTSKEAVSKVEAYLKSKGIMYKTIKSKLQSHIEYNSLMSNKATSSAKDVQYSIQSATTLAELLPATQGHNDDTGTMFGIDRLNRHPYLVDLTGTSNAKNILVVAPSGKGKTYLCITWALDMYATGFNIVSSDIKGTEFKAMTSAMNGLSIPMRQDSRKFINTLVMNKEHVKDGDPLLYFNSRFKLSIDMMLIIADMDESMYGRLEALLRDFLQASYTGDGVLPDNPNTWSRSEGLHPHQLYEKFEEYVSQDIRRIYPDIVDLVLNRFKLFFHKNGSHSYMFLEEYNLDELYERKCITFDFGILDTADARDPVVFKLHLMFMKVMNSDYIRYKKSLGEWTFKLEEEAQYAEDYLLRMYADDFSIRRAQNQVTAILTNSIEAIKDKPDARPIIDNANIIVIGAVSTSARDYLIKEYGLESHRESLERMVDDPNYDNTFLIVNRLRSGATSTLIKVFNPEEVSRGKIYKVVDTTSE